MDHFDIWHVDTHIRKQTIETTFFLYQKLWYKLEIV